MVRIHFMLSTPVRYYSCSGLSDNIKSYLSQMQPYAEVVIKEPERKFRISQQIQSNREIVSYREGFFEWPEGTEFSVFVASSDIIDQHSELIDNINNEIIRFGNDITLGCGVLKVADIDDEDGNKYDVPQRNNTSVVSFSMLCNLKDGIKISNNSNEQQTISEGGADNPTINASTLKGVFRNRCYKLAMANGIDSRCIDIMFGNREKNNKGCIIFYDSKFEDTAKIEKQVNYHIDKFTREVIHNDIRSYDIAMGEVQIWVQYLHNIENTSFRTEILFLITRVFLDLANQRCNIGGGWAQGRGFIDPIRLVVKQGSLSLETLFEIDYLKNTIVTGNSYLNSLFYTMKNRYKPH